jgi:hypothetical protein
MSSGFNEPLGLHSGDTQPNPVVRIEHGVVVTGPVAEQRTDSSQQPFWRGMVAAALVVILIAAALTAILLALPPAHPYGDAHARLTPTWTASPTPTALLGVTQSWGPTAAQLTLTTQLDATHIFQATAITPDGTLLLGLSNDTVHHTSQAGYLRVATKTFQAMGNTGALKLNSPYCCVTDGRFVLLTDTIVSGATCANCNLRYSVFDLMNDTLRQVAVGSSFGGISNAMLDHGVLLLQTVTAGLQMLDLTTPTPTPTAFIALDAAAPAPLGLVAFTWPDVIYRVAPTPGAPSLTLRLRDLATQRDIPLVATSDPIPVNARVSAVLTNDTLFLAFPQHGTLQVDEWDHATTGGTTLKPLATYPDSDGTLLAANARLVTLMGAYPFAWDRAQAHWVALTQTADVTTETLAGHFLAVMMGAGTAAPQHITLYDTDALPT